MSSNPAPSLLREHAEGLRHNAHIFRDLNQRSRERQLYDAADGLCKAADEIERLNQWADGFSDRQLNERSTAELYQRELRSEIARLRAALEKIATGKARDGGVADPQLYAIETLWGGAYAENALATQNVTEDR